MADINGIRHLIILEYIIEQVISLKRTVFLKCMIYAKYCFLNFIDRTYNKFNRHSSAAILSLNDQHAYAKGFQLNGKFFG